MWSLLLGVSAPTCGCVDRERGGGALEREGERWLCEEGRRADREGEGGHATGKKNLTHTHKKRGGLR